MSYLLDKKIKRKKISYIIFFVVILLILFYFRSGIFNSLALFSHTIFRPVLILGNNLGGKLRSIGSYFVSKNFLYLENQNLKSQLNEKRGLIENYNSILAENINLKEILGRKKEEAIAENMILSAILAKPNQSLYDALVIDVGTKQGIKIGDIVFALGHSLTGEALGTVPIGRVSTVYGSSSKVTLFSSSGEKTNIVIFNESVHSSDALGTGKNIFMEVVGRGGGNFEMVLPEDFRPAKGDRAVLPGIFPYVLGIVETIISDPRSPFVKALLVSPVNIQELKFVEVELQK